MEIYLSCFFARWLKVVSLVTLLCIVVYAGIRFANAHTSAAEFSKIQIETQDLPAPRMKPGPRLTSTAESRNGSGAVQATSADVFVDSVGVDTHWTFPPYFSHQDALISLLVNSRIRHIRDGVISGAMRVLVKHGIHETMVIDPAHGVVPNKTYWSAAPRQSTYTVDEYIKTQMPAGAVDALEMPNELDVFYYLYKWQPQDTSTLSKDASAPNYYGAYGDQRLLAGDQVRPGSALDQNYRADGRCPSSLAIRGRLVV